MTFRLAILGCGVGEKHLEAWKDLEPRARVHRIVDLDVQRAGSLARFAGDAIASQNIDYALRDPEIDIVDICLPPHLHADTVLRSLQSGKHVVCEKPLAGSVVEADQIAAVARSAGRQCFPVFQYRYGRGIRTMERLRRGGLLGKPLVGSLETHWNRSDDYYAKSWRGTWSGELGGAVLIHAIHIHDLASLLFGRISTVSALLDTRVNAIETEDCAALCMQTEQGGLLTSSVTLGAASNQSRIRLAYSRLTAESGTDPYRPGHAGWRFVARDPKDQKDVDKVVATECEQGGDSGYKAMFTCILNALESGDKLAPNVADGVGSIELAAAIYLSHRERRAVTLPLNRSHLACRHLRYCD